MKSEIWATYKSSSNNCMKCSSNPSNWYAWRRIEA